MLYLRGSDDLYNARYTEGSVYLNLDGIEDYDSYDKIIDYYDILTTYQKCQQDKLELLSYQKDKDEACKEIHAFIEKYNTVDRQKLFIKKLNTESNWEKRNNALDMLKCINLAEENALFLVKKNLENIIYLKSVPQSVMDYLFIKDEPVLREWMQKISINHCINNQHIIQMCPLQIETYIKNYLKRIPWSFEILLPMKESNAISYFFATLDYKFNQSMQYNHVVGVKKGGIRIIEKMDEDKFIKLRCKDIFKFIVNFPAIMTHENMCNIVLLFPHFLQTFKKHDRLKQYFEGVVKDNEFMESFFSKNVDFCTNEKNMKLLKSLGVCENLYTSFKNTKKKKENVKKFKY